MDCAPYDSRLMGTAGSKEGWGAWHSSHRFAGRRQHGGPGFAAAELVCCCAAVQQHTAPALEAPAITVPLTHCGADLDRADLRRQAQRAHVLAAHEADLVQAARRCGVQREGVQFGSGCSETGVDCTMHSGDMSGHVMSRLPPDAAAAIPPSAAPATRMILKRPPFLLLT